MEGELPSGDCRGLQVHGAYVWLDEAHSIGPGPPQGRVRELADPKDVDIMMGTFTVVWRRGWTRV